MTSIFTWLQFLYAFAANQESQVAKPLITENVIIVVVDGARISETWLDSNQHNIPRQKALLSEGVLLNNYRNTGPTLTISGHAALLTGKTMKLHNSGMESPSAPTIFQQFQKQKDISPEQTWLVASKGKLAILANCTDSLWRDVYQPSTNCGVNGGGVLSGYRDDSTTTAVLFEILNKHHPKLSLVNFREPDYSAHAGDSLGYIKGIQNTDEYIHQIWQFIQNDPIYQNKTTLFITNDHGRHLDSIPPGFIDHGDDCEGCRRISMLALGPDFKQNTALSTPYCQIDLPTTIARLLGFDFSGGKGKIMEELFK